VPLSCAAQRAHDAPSGDRLEPFTSHFETCQAT
jgi:hypothetical protein